MKETQAEGGSRLADSVAVYTANSMIVVTGAEQLM